MKRDMNDLNLRNAFPAEPDSCHQALMQAARSAREEAPVKKHTFRTALLAALILAAMMAVAVAATQGGLVNWFQDAYHAVLPRAAQEVLGATEKTTLDAGPVIFTINELLCDGKIAYLTAEAQLKEEGSAILFPDSDDPYGRIGEVTAQKLNHPDITESTTWLEAAQITGLPLYNAAAWLELEEASAGMIECEMMDGTVLENRNLLLVRMLYLNENAAGDSLPVEIIARTMELDLSTVEYLRENEHRACEKRSLPIHGVTAEKAYAPAQPALLSGQFTLTGVTARQTCAGVYVHICASTAEPMTMVDFWETNFEWDVLTPQGERYPTGVSLTSEMLDAQGRPFPADVPPEEVTFSAFQYMLMISADELPASFLVTDGETQVMVE